MAGLVKIFQLVKVITPRVEIEQHILDINAGKQQP